LAICGDYCQPHFSEKRNLYIFIRKKKKWIKMKKTITEKITKHYNFFDTLFIILIGLFIGICYNFFIIDDLCLNYQIEYCIYEVISTDIYNILVSISLMMTIYLSYLIMLLLIDWCKNGSKRY
jgi:hypothetical protein